MTQTKCRSLQCKGADNGMRSLVEDYNLKLVVYDLKTNNKMLITAYKKNIDMDDDEEEEEEEKFSHPNQSEEEDEDYIPDLM